MNTYLIAGLGNPGKDYELSRHNLGFLILDQLQHYWEKTETVTISNFSQENKFNALLSMAKADGQKIILAKPQTFMNLSGQAIQKIAAFYNIELDRILVIHDDLDLPLGKIRFSQNSGPAGHNGIKSIIETLGTQNFTRLRIGILLENKEISKKILDKFSAAERKTLEQNSDYIIEAILFFIQNGFQSTASKYN